MSTEDPRLSGDITLFVQWRFTLDRKTSLLVLKALGGRLNPAEVEEAKALGDRLTKLRADEARQFYEHLQRHADNIVGESHER